MTAIIRTGAIAILDLLLIIVLSIIGASALSYILGSPREILARQHAVAAVLDVGFSDAEVTGVCPPDDAEFCFEVTGTNERGAKETVHVLMHRRQS